MEKTIKWLGVTEEEIRRMDEEAEQMMIRIRETNEKLLREEGEIAQLQAETRNLIAQMKERQRGQATV
jgi:peptidoglycan hydrolase CwlO-like protein